MRLLKASIFCAAVLTQAPAAISGQAGCLTFCDALVPGGAMVALESATIEQFLAVVNADYPSFNAQWIDKIPNREIYLIQFDQPSQAMQDAFEHAMRFDAD